MRRRLWRPADPRLTGDLPVSIGEGGAVPGDRIVGILTPGEGSASTRSTRRNCMSSITHLHWIDVTWDVSDIGTERFPAIIDVTVLNQPGILAQVAR